ncbi:MAG: hypothetical protein LCH58_00665 [Bacteroidetes bacterium]|uniref:hypothetical protein n=1 Tax=Phnomibacter sp. TaxID=2836217 RepID=UPI002FDD9943|nr:hypothetical protein [Bacteroidota bacterium]
MTINRNNYENFFLLYVDGELAPQQMLEVDAFCEKHPDLAEELQLLMDTRLTPDHELAFEGKDDLLQPELWDADQLTPLQSSLLDLLDRTPTADPNTLSNEPLVQKEWQLLQHTRLTAEAAAMPQKHRLIKAMQWDADNLTSTQLQLLEALDNGGTLPAAVLADAETHKDWLLLQQTLLQPEAVLMPNKEKLLRSEAGEKAPVVRLAAWKKLAVAAAVIGIGWFAFFNNSNTTTVTEEQPMQAKVNTPGSKQPSVQSVAQADSNQQVLPKQPTPDAPQAQYAVNQPGKQTPVITTTVQTATTQPATTAQDNAQSNEERARMIAAYRLSPEETAALNAGQTPKAMKANIQTEAMPATLAVQANSNSKMQASYAAMTEMETEEEDNSINIAGAKINKQKLRGVFRTVTRKVTRSFDKSEVVAANDNGAATMK